MLVPISEEKKHPLPSPTAESGYALISTKRYTDPKPFASHRNTRICSYISQNIVKF